MSESIINEERLGLIALNSEDLARYSRHLLLPELKAAGQRRIKAARVLCIGAGGLGSPAALYLAAAGVGTIGFVDFDRVDISNLQRQVLYGTNDVGRQKLGAATERIRETNPNVEVVSHDCRFTSENAQEVVAPYDVVIDGSDNFPTRYLSNDVCVFARKPNIYGSVFRFEGQASVFAPHLGGPCYRCLFPEPPPPGAAPSCAEAGVLGVLPGIIGLVQATEALKLIVGEGEPLIGRLLHFDALKMKFREFKLRRDPECPVCGEHPTIFRPIDYERFLRDPNCCRHCRIRRHGSIRDGPGVKAKNGCARSTHSRRCAGAVGIRRRANYRVEIDPTRGIRGAPDRTSPRRNARHPMS